MSSSLCDLGERGIRRRIGFNRNQFRARHHDLAGGQVGEGEDAVEHLLFRFLEYTRLLARGHEHLELFLGMDHRMAAAAAQAEQVDHGATGAVQHADERPECPHEDFGRLDDPQRRHFRSLERYRFRRQFAEHDVQRGDDRERDRHGNRVGGRRGEQVGHDRKRGLDHRSQRRLADPAKADAGHRDPELCRGDVAVRIRHRASHRVRPPVALGDQLIDPRLADCDDGELGGDEEPVGEDQAQDRDQTPDNVF